MEIKDLIDIVKNNDDAKSSILQNGYNTSNLHDVFGHIPWQIMPLSVFRLYKWAR